MEEAPLYWRIFYKLQSRDLHPVDGRLNQTGYHGTLPRDVITSGTWFVAQGFIHLQVNDLKIY